MIKFPDYDGQAFEVTRDNDFKSAFHLFWCEFTDGRGGYGMKARVSHLQRLLPHQNPPEDFSADYLGDKWWKIL